MYLELFAEAPPIGIEIIDKYTRGRIPDVYGRDIYPLLTNRDSSVDHSFHSRLRDYRYLVAREFWLPNLGLEPIVALGNALDERVILDAATHLEAKIRAGPQLFVIEICHSAA